MADALLPPRGEITDRNGVPLARAFPAYALWFNPRDDDGGDGGPPLVKSPEEVARELKAIFPDLDRHEMTEQLRVRQARLPAPPHPARGRQPGDRDRRTGARNSRARPTATIRKARWPRTCSAMSRPTGMAGSAWRSVLTSGCSIPSAARHPVALSIDMRVQGALEDELRSGMLAVECGGRGGHRARRRYRRSAGARLAARIRSQQ